MAFKEKGFQTAAALCVGATAVAFGAPPAGVAEGTTAAAGLIGFVLDRKSQFGPECPRVLKKIRARVREGYETLIRQEGYKWHAHADLEAADIALHETLQSCMIDRKRLAEAAVTPEGFPKAALTAVMADLSAKRPDLFGPDKSQTLGYRYAKDVIRVGLEAAVENVDYYRALEPALMLEMAKELGEIRDTGRRIDKTTQETGQRVQRIEDLVAQILADQGSDVARDLLETLALDFGHDNPKASDAELRAFLDSKANDYARLKVQIAALADADGRVANLVAAAQSAVDAGDFPEADACLRDAEEIQQAERTLSEVRKQANIRAARAEAALLSGDAEAALAFFQTAASLFDPFDREEGAQARDKFQHILHEHGVRYGGPAIAGAVSLLSENLVIWKEVDHPLQWAATQNNIGNALSHWGQRTQGQPGADLLARAVTAYRAGLKVYTKDSYPLDWAGIQNNLGNTLTTQGERTRGLPGAELIAKAVAAYFAALKVYTADDFPLKWAMTQINLSNALRSQGERTQSHPGTSLLADAVTASLAALSVYTEDDHPLHWARAQNNLGNALGRQGERTQGKPGICLLANAVIAFQSALNVYTQENHPLEWARTQSNLGTAFLSQGQRMKGRQGLNLLAEAVSAFREALKVYTEEDHPLDWAMCQNNLGIALASQGDRTQGQPGAELLAHAVVAYRSVLRVYTEDDHPLQWATTENNLGTALINQAQRTHAQFGVGLLIKAVTAFRVSLKVRTEGDYPLDWARTQENIGYALMLLADRQDTAEGSKTLRESLAAFDAALTVFDPEHTGFYFEKCQRARDGVAARLNG